MDKIQAQMLLERYETGTCTPDERALVEQWYDDLAKKQEVLEIDFDVLLLQDKSLRTIRYQTRRPKWLMIGMAAAASITLIFCAGLYFYSFKNDKQYIKRITKTDDVLPGGNKAFITLADGRKISLTDAKNGKLVAEAGLQITKTADGQLVYEAVPDKAGKPGLVSEIKYNTIETPKGGQYQVRLPDGTKIWLNAASSLKYPAKFFGAERSVELTGEAYFEVAHNKNMPFIVKTATQQVKVLGTHFNINSYTDEDETVTTLAQGAVCVSSLHGKFRASKSAILKPGEQSVVRPAADAIVVKQADLEMTLGWKNGFITFNSADLQTIMRQVARWYNLDVKYEGKIPQRTFSGRISRNSNLSALMKILELSNIHFSIEEIEGITKLIIKP